MVLIPSVLERSLIRAIDPFVRFLALTRITPNILTTAGFGSNLTAAALLMRGTFVPAGMLILLGGLFDVMDGRVARMARRASIYGAVYDATVDRVGELAIYTGLGAFFVIHGMNSAAFLTVVAVAGSLLVSYVRARAESYNVPCNVGILPRASRVVLIGLGCALDFLTAPLDPLVRQFSGNLLPPPMPIFVALAVIAVCSPITIVQRLRHVRLHEQQ